MGNIMTNVTQINCFRNIFRLHYLQFCGISVTVLTEWQLLIDFFTFGCVHIDKNLLYT